MGHRGAGGLRASCHPDAVAGTGGGGIGRSDEARRLIESCLRLDPTLLPAIRDVMEYDLCAGNWARAWELASPIGADEIAEPLLRPLDRLRQPARHRARIPEPAVPVRVWPQVQGVLPGRDLEVGVHPLPDRAPALYAMLATYAQRGPIAR